MTQSTKPQKARQKLNLFIMSNIAFLVIIIKVTTAGESLPQANKDQTKTMELASGSDGIALDPIQGLAHNTSPRMPTLAGTMLLVPAEDNGSLFLTFPFPCLKASNDQL